MGSILVTVIELLYWALFVLILARIILSYVQTGYYEIRALVYRITEPVLAPVRKILPATGGFDLSPIIVLLVANLLKRVLQGFVVSL
jgi:YggT family protein